MPPRSDVVLFLDLETTGANKHREEIVQVGAVVLRAPDWAETSHFEHVVLPSEEAYGRMVATPVVREMHEKTGLMERINELRASYPEIASPAVVDDLMINWINETCGTDTSHVPYGGSGVSHYDRPFIERQLPRFNRRITYWALDVAPVRRIALMAGRKDWPVMSEGNHDALADARFHAREFRFALRILGAV
jgi:oligoribonuclease (3'-5' exoribonuclease)